MAEVNSGAITFANGGPESRHRAVARLARVIDLDFQIQQGLAPARNVCGELVLS